MAVILTVALLIDFEVESETATDEEVIHAIEFGDESTEIRNSITRKLERCLRLEHQFINPGVGWVDDNREIILGEITDSRVKALGKKK